MAYQIVDRLGERQIEDLHRLFQREFWSRNRTPADIRQMLERTDAIVGVVDTDDDRLVGFARALTDGVYRAMIYDVIVDADRRKTGLGRTVIETLINHPLVRGAERVELYCRGEMVPFYNKWAFTDQLGEVRLMRRKREA